MPQSEANSRLREAIISRLIRHKGDIRDTLLSHLSYCRHGITRPRIVVINKSYHFCDTTTESHTFDYLLNANWLPLFVLPHVGDAAARQLEYKLDEITELILATICGTIQHLPEPFLAHFFELVYSERSFSECDALDALFSRITSAAAPSYHTFVNSRS